MSMIDCEQLQKSVHCLNIKRKEIKMKWDRVVNFVSKINIVGGGFYILMGLLTLDLGHVLFGLFFLAFGVFAPKIMLR